MVFSYMTEHVHISYTVKKVNEFPVPSRDDTNQTLPGGNNLTIPGQGEFGKRHPGWGRENC
jgi:hypothetical protein